MAEVAPNQSSSVKQMNIEEVHQGNIITKYGNKKWIIGFGFLILGAIIVTVVLATTLQGRFLKSLSNRI